MSASEPTATATARVRLECEDWELETALTVPAGPTRTRDLLPLLQSLSDAVVGATINVLKETGGRISCAKGCGACCRHLVLISEVEARHIRDLLETLPEPRRSAVRDRFTAACLRLEEAGLIERLRHSEDWTPEGYEELALAYFHLQVPCPFLDEESCSIHPQRPITCREYLVTSPPEHCARPATEEISRLRIPLPIFNAVARMEVPGSTHHLESSVPLILAPQWADAHPDEPPPRPGAEVLREFLGHLSRKVDV